MKSEEKQLLKDMYDFIEHLHIKVKILDDLKERAIDKVPELFTTDQLTRWEESNKKIAVKNLESLKARIESISSN